MICARFALVCAAALVALPTAGADPKPAPKAKPAPAAKPAKADRGAPRLNRKEAEIVDAATAAHARGDQAGILQLLAPFANKLNPARTLVVEAALKDRGLPTLGRLLGDARLTMIEQGWVGRMPKITPREAVLLLPAFDAYVEESIAPPKNIDGPEPDLTALKNVEEYEALLWKLHVRRNRAESANRVVAYANQVRGGFNEKQLARLTEPERALFRHDPKEAQDKVDRAIVDLAEHEIDARVQRLARALDVLAGDKLTAERYLAAYTWRLDSGRIREYFQALAQAQPPRQPSRPALAVADLPQQVEKLATECETKAGDLTQRAEWLFEGLHWWLRGRYGAGTEVFGLAKSQQALASPMALFPLMMPAVTPKPTAPGTTYSISEARPFYDRRHLYWWAWEDRGVVSNTQNVETSRSTNYQDWCRTGGYFY